jgi:uncharacterized protein
MKKRLESIKPSAPGKIDHPVMFQQWNDLTFLHWPIDPKIVQLGLPKDLTVDTFQNNAWIGITPFYLSHLSAPVFPPLPWISAFPETNLRTYVIDQNGKRGIYFFTLEADRLLAVIGARIFYHLPYHWSDMNVAKRSNIVTYSGKRKKVKYFIEIEVGEKIVGKKLNEFDHFLTARYRMYTKVGRSIVVCQIEHEPWPLYKAKIKTLEQNITHEYSIFIVEQDPIVHFSPGVFVSIGSLEVA